MGHIREDLSGDIPCVSLIFINFSPQVQRYNGTKP